MKIINYKKKTKNTYEVTLSNNESVILYEDIIFKYELLLKKEITKNELDKAKKENENYFIYYEALKYITKKMRTEKEIRTKFKEYNSISVDYAIDRLKQEKYINNDIYIKSYINDIINLKLDGPLKIKSNLNKLGFTDIEINSYLDTIENDIWTTKINKIITKEININKKYSSYLLKNKIQTKLINLGYPKELINSELNNYNFIDNQDIYIKEKEKAIKKYSKKYSGYELEMKVKNYLYQKGFREM